MGFGREQVKEMHKSVHWGEGCGSVWLEDKNPGNLTGRSLILGDEPAFRKVVIKELPKQNINLQPHQNCQKFREEWRNENKPIQKRLEYYFVPKQPKQVQNREQQRYQGFIRKKIPHF